MRDARLRNGLCAFGRHRSPSRARWLRDQSMRAEQAGTGTARHDQRPWRMASTSSSPARSTIPVNGRAPAFAAPEHGASDRVDRGWSSRANDQGRQSRRAARHATDVRDMARAYVGLMQKGTPSTIYNVASGVARSMRSILEALVARARVTRAHRNRLVTPSSQRHARSSRRRHRVAHRHGLAAPDSVRAHPRRPAELLAGVTHG